MAKRRKMWVYSPPKPPKPKVPDAVKTDVEAKASALIETVLKPEHDGGRPRSQREPQPDFEIGSLTQLLGLLALD